MNPWEALGAIATAMAMRRPADDGAHEHKATLDDRAEPDEPREPDTLLSVYCDLEARLAMWASRSRFAEGGGDAGFRSWSLHADGHHVGTVIWTGAALTLSPEQAPSVCPWLWEDLHDLRARALCVSSSEGSK